MFFCYLFIFNFYKIVNTSGWVGVNFTPLFNILRTFFAFCSIVLATCSLVTIKWFPAIVYSRSIYLSVIGNISCMRNALSRLSSNFTICIISHGFPAFSLFSTIFYICLFCLIMVSSKIFPYQNPQNNNNEACFLPCFWIFLCGCTAVPEERIPPIRRQETAVPEQGYRT